MARVQHRRWRWRLGRWIVARLPGGASIVLGTPGRRLRLGRRGLTLRLGRPGVGITVSWRRSWRQLWNDISRRRRVGARSRSRRRS